jgi:hypothetical protein
VKRRTRKSIRIELAPELETQPREQTGGSGSVESVELKIEELEQRVTPRPIGTFF